MNARAKALLLDTIERVAIVFGVITWPLWVLPVMFFMNPGKKQRADYARYREFMGYEPIPDQNRIKAMIQSMRNP